MTDNLKTLTDFTQTLKQADGLLITAGAGMGVDSGLPDFRGEKGFWKAYPPLQKLNINFKEMATPALFDSNPKLAWGFYGLRLLDYRAVVPHQGFHLLKQWSDTLPNLTNGAFVFTSNVDGEFQKVGFEENQVFECHGSIHQLQCANRCTPDVWSADNYTPVVDSETCELVNDLPKCPHCGGLARPNVFMFSDWQWLADYQDIKERHLMAWLKPIRNLAIIELGAGDDVNTVRSFGEKLVKYSTDKTISLLRVNPSQPDIPTDLSKCFGVAMGAKDALIELNQLLEKE